VIDAHQHLILRHSIGYDWMAGPKRMAQPHGGFAAELGPVLGQIRN
jgi:predicted TIM-barrel fold metal-dependent hydrolase